ncbi:MAG TPA: hypothetical protein VD996_18120 [Chitinophagaceae bacterium]|nr:hypothetical protein [Chitinophagaceae bacterium]
MKTVLLFCFLGLLALPVLAQTGDTTLNQVDSVREVVAKPAYVEDDFPPFLLLMMLTGLLVVGAGVVLCVFALAVVFGLAAFGVLSVSVVTGMYKRSLEKGFRVFMLLGGSVGGMLAGAIVGFVAERYFDVDVQLRAALLYGALAGLVAGLIGGWIGFVIIKWMVVFIKQKITAP